VNSNDQRHPDCQYLVTAQGDVCTKCGSVHWGVTEDGYSQAWQALPDHGPEGPAYRLAYGGETQHDMGRGWTEDRAKQFCNLMNILGPDKDPVEQVLYMRRESLELQLRLGDVVL